jgi:hypothetical protein
MSAKDSPKLNRCVNVLMRMLADKQESLRRCESSIGKGHNLKRMIRLRKEIRSLETLLARADRLHEELMLVEFEEPLSDSLHPEGL